MAPAPKPEYRFECRIVDLRDDRIVERDFTHISEIGEFGECESVDQCVGRLLRIFNSHGRDEYERENYQTEETEVTP